MSIDTTIDHYRETKERMQAIIDRHMSEAFDEISREYNSTPVSVSLDVFSQQTMAEEHANGVYTGCTVQLDVE